MVALHNNVGAANGANATLKINSLEAKPIYYKGAAITAGRWPSKAISLFIYNTTDLNTGCWSLVWSYGENTTYTNAGLGSGYATCSTAAGTKAKTASLSSYALTAGGIVAVKFTNANTVAGATLNINSKGAKNIYYRGESIGTDIIAAGDLVTMIYDGTQYHILSIDRGAEVADRTTGSVTFVGTTGNKVFNGSEDVTIGYSDVGALASTTVYAKGATQNGNAVQANKTTGTLTIGDKTFNGSANVTIGAEDLGLSQAMSFRGSVADATEMTDGWTTQTVTLKDGGSLTAKAGDVVLHSNYEYVWTGTAWERLGPDGSYALNSVTVTGSNGLTGGGNLTANRVISHKENSVTSSAATSAPTSYITAMTFDKYGHPATYTTYDARAQFLRSISFTDDNVVNIDKTSITASSSSTPSIALSHAKRNSAGENEASAKAAWAAVADDDFSLGAGETGYIIIPKINIDAYGHAAYLGQSKIGFTIPNPKASLTITTTNAVASANTLSTTYSPTGSNQTFTLGVVKGANGVAGSDGFQGLVPQPKAATADYAKFLRGDGTWSYSVEWVDF